MAHLAFPYDIDGGGRTAALQDRAAYARRLIEIVLFTAPGERVNRPEFGSGLLDLLFEPNSEAQRSATEFLIQSALQRYLSDLVAVEALETVQSGGVLEITLTYTVRGDAERRTETFTRPGA